MDPMNRNGVLYRLTLPSGKSYLGVTHRTPHYRFRAHVSRANGGKLYPISKAIRKYGPASVKVETLVIGKMWYLLELELVAIDRFKTLVPDGYNLALGGTAPMLGRKHSVKTRKQISRKKEQHPRWGTEHTEEAKKRMKKNSWMAGRTGELNPFWGKKHTPETKRKMSEGWQRRLKEITK